MLMAVTAQQDHYPLPLQSFVTLWGFGGSPKTSDCAGLTGSTKEQDKMTTDPKGITVELLREAFRMDEEQGTLIKPGNIERQPAPFSCDCGCTD